MRFEMIITNKKYLLYISIIVYSSILSCLPYLTTDRENVLLKNVDIYQTLKIAETEMHKKNGKLGVSLYLWSIRDQYISSGDASHIAKLYWDVVDSLKYGFDRWHLTWAISNAYKSGDDSVRLVLTEAYQDATSRARLMGGIADKMVNGEKIYRGDAHSGGRAFAMKHVVVPGNEKYIQSFEAYEDNKKSK
jgi:hypothetical protein